MLQDWCIWTPYLGAEVYIRTVSAEQIVGRVQEIMYNPRGDGVALLADCIEIFAEESASGPSAEERDGGSGRMPDSQAAWVSLATERWGAAWTIAAWRQAAGPQKLKP